MSFTKEFRRAAVFFISSVGYITRIIPTKKRKELLSAFYCILSLFGGVINRGEKIRKWNIIEFTYFEYRHKRWNFSSRFIAVNTQMHFFNKIFLRVVVFAAQFFYSLSDFLNKFRINVVSCFLNHVCKRISSHRCFFSFHRLRYITRIIPTKSRKIYFPLFVIFLWDTSSLKRNLQGTCHITCKILQLRLM